MEQVYLVIGVGMLAVSAGGRDLNSAGDMAEYVYRLSMSMQMIVWRR